MSDESVIRAVKAKLKDLPPDPEEQNNDRSKWANVAVMAFVEKTGMKEDTEFYLSDLLTDLMHWADRSGFEFEHELSRARANYADETRG